MKTLTIKQPWASLIIDGYKKYEFRSWKTNYRGKLLIHAGASIDKNEISQELLDQHREKIHVLQHERLVHLIVTVMVVLTELFVTELTLLHPELGPLPPLVMLALAVLLGFYFYHYFFL